MGDGGSGDDGMTGGGSESAPPAALRKRTVVEFDTAGPVPAQWLQDRPRRPEHRLMFAVLEDAVMAYFRRMATSTPELGRCEAREWIASDNVSWPFSFVNICTHLGYDPEYLRASILRRERVRIA